MLDVRRGSQLARQEALELLEVVGDHLENEVDFAVEHMALADLGENLATCCLERAQVGFGLAASG